MRGTATHTDGGPWLPVRRAVAADLPGLRALLASASLPVQGLEACGPNLWVWPLEGAVAGAIGFEPHGPDALLRSLAVDPGHRGQGIGLALLRNGVREMQRAGVRHAYGLTTTIAPLLSREGWVELPQAAMPPHLLGSQELQGACPAGARAFRLDVQAGLQG